MKQQRVERGDTERRMRSFKSDDDFLFLFSMVMIPMVNDQTPFSFF